MKFYAGIGSRQTPQRILNEMFDLARQLEALGYTLRSGGASGSDSAFAQGCARKQIFLPWADFNGIVEGIVCGDDARLREIAQQHHPAWDRCSSGARKLHTRNVAQILGITDPPILSEFVVCWTRGSGGTAQTLRIAETYGVAIYNLAVAGTYDRFTEAHLVPPRAA